MSDLQLRLLLLRRLPDEETARLEESILLEDGFAERLRNEEFDLLDEYAASRLNAEDAADVERSLLRSEESCQSLRVARALLEVGKQRSAQPTVPAAASVGGRRRRTSRVWGFAALLAACLVIVAYLPLWHAPLGLGSVRPAGGQSAAPIISLLADVDRGPRPVLAIPAGSAAIRLQTEVPAPTTGARYSLQIRDSAGRQLFASLALEVRTAGRYRFVEVQVPAAALAPGDRTVTLTDSGDLASADAHFTWQVTGVFQ